MISKYTRSPNEEILSVFLTMGCTVQMEMHRFLASVPVAVQHLLVERVVCLPSLSCVGISGSTTGATGKQH